MRMILLGLLVSSCLIADPVAIQPAGVPVIITDYGTVSSNAVVTPAADGWSVAFDPIFAAPEYSEVLEILQNFSVPESALFTLSTDATATLVGSGCSHGFCPGLSLSVLGEAMVSSADATTAEFLENGDGPASSFSRATVSGSNSQTFDIAAGNYILVQFLSVDASDAGVWSQMSIQADVSLIDPPSEVPEGRWTALVAIAVLLTAGIAGRRARFARLAAQARMK
jgi:hypothetical protein